MDTLYRQLIQTEVCAKNRMEINMQKNIFYNMLKKNAELYSDNIAVLYDTMEITFKKLFNDSWKKAIHLQRFEGKRIAIYGPASYRWIVNVFGTILAGKDAVLVDFFLPKDVRQHLLKKVGIDYTLTSTNQYILADSDAIIIPNADKDNVDGFKYDLDTEEGNIIMFTATADECDKAVVLTGDNIFNTVNAINGFCECTHDDKVLAQIALNHIFGFIYSLIWPLSNGACICVGRGLRHIDADTYYYNPTILPGTPSMIEYLKKIRAFNDELKTVVIGGATCPFHLFETLKDRDMNVYNIYGMTEATGCIGINDSMDGSYALFDKEAVAIADDGEILVKGDCVMKGYDNDKAATDAVIKDGYLHTGDYGRINDKGRLVLIKRNPGIILLPTGEKISRKITNQQITALNGIAESYITLYEDKLTALIVPMYKSIHKDRIKKLIDKYNEKKGYRWEIQRIVVSENVIPKMEDGTIDTEEVENILAEDSNA